MPLSLQDDIRILRGVGPSLAEKLERLGIATVGDLLTHYPREYEDRRSLSLLGYARDGERATFLVEVVEHSTFYHRGRHHPKITVADRSGRANLYCFNRPYLTDALPVGASVYLTGAPSLKYNVPGFSQFDFEAEKGDREPGIVPVYRLTAGVSQKVLRRLIRSAFDAAGQAIGEDIPPAIVHAYRFKPKGELMRDMHFPSDMDSLKRSREALSYQEFFTFQLVVSLARSRTVKVVKDRGRGFSGDARDRLLGALPFTLTRAQHRVLEEIEEDLRKPSPMNRLVQGDVGCGKTLVALLAALDAVEAGGQAAFMAPTEVLALQHHHTLSRYLESLEANVSFLSGSVRGARRGEVLASLESGDAPVIVGTHALFSEDVLFRNLSLAVIDEQQKFGVLQRGSLRAKGNHPDCLVMSATPIPRTLSMTLYGDLDVSIIDEMPPGRGEVVTEIARQAEIHRVYERVGEELERGRQAYFIYPVIEESSTADIKNANDSYEHLKRDVFPRYGVGLLHGRMDEEEKSAVMEKFRSGEYRIVVSTTVIEVGIDVPNATVMVVEQAERFGLSTIHQLRGRVGRGGDRSFCFLVPDRSTGRESFQRLKILKETRDGFKIAEWDLRMRGPGEILGKKQSGVPSFLIDDLGVNTRLIHRAQKDARRYIDGEVRDEEERERYLASFTASEGYRRAMLYFGG